MQHMLEKFSSKGAEDEGEADSEEEHGGGGGR